MVRDSTATLGKFMRGGTIAPGLFHATVGTLVAGMSAFGRRVRIYGDMVDILYDPENPDHHGRDGTLDLFWGPALLGLAAAFVLVRGTVGLGRG